MLAPPRRSFARRALLLLGVAILALGLLPPQVTEAAVAQSSIDNSIADFGRGAFQRSALGPLLNTTISPKDAAGAIQLGPIGLLKQWNDSAFILKKPLTRMGATAIGNRIFIVGGKTPVGNATQSVADVWSAAVSQANGVFLEDWQAEPALLAVKGSNHLDFDDPVAEINSAGVVSVATGTSSGYIYVIGGNTQPNVNSAFSFSSYAVRIGTVGSNGRISGWVAGPPIPTPDPSDTGNFQQLGIESPAVHTMVVGGQTYVYVVGGLKRYVTGLGGNFQTVQEGSRDVFYARVGSGGQLVKPSNGQAGWDKLTPIPVPGASPAGIWDAVLLGDHFVASTGDSADVLYVIGGQLTPDAPPSTPTFSSKIYRAFVESNGTLTWDFGWQGTLPETRTAMAGETFRGSLYVVGGLPSNGNEPDKGVLTSYVEDSVELHQFNAGEVPPGIDGGGSNFLKSTALRFARAFHATAIVPADSSSVNSAFIYVFGGRGRTQELDGQASNKVFYGKIGGDEDTTAGYAASGWYYSKPYDINFTGAQLQKIYWATQIDRSTADPDIVPEYRVSSANTCANATWTEADWKPLDAVESDALHASAHGLNTSAPINLTARCFQYRVKLTTNNFLMTPSLLNVSIDVLIPGNPDLNFNRLAPRLGANKTLLGLDVFIQNKNTFEETLAADLDKPGGFWVDLCIFGPDEQATTLTLPLTNQNTQCSDIYAEVNRSLMGPFAIYSVTGWRYTVNIPTTTVNERDQPVGDLLKFFTKPGVYKVTAAVDSTNEVVEGTLGGESNNIFPSPNTTYVTFEVGKVGYIISLPVIRR